MNNKFIRILCFGWFFISVLNQNIYGQTPPFKENLYLIDETVTHVPHRIYKPTRLENISPGQYTKAHWQEIIDSTWGHGLPTAEKLQIFDVACDYIDDGYGAFVNYNVNIDSLRNLYRPEIEEGVSRGRFAAIMNFLAYALKDAHTSIDCLPVNGDTELQPGIPLFVIGAWGNQRHFGAGLTPLPDSTLLVYKVVPNHPLDLQPGDIVLGYDGILWKQLYEQLLDAQLPLRNYLIGSNDESATHILLQSAGLNWHLFDTIDFVRYSSGDTVHLPTALLQNQFATIWGNEQMPIPGVDFPNIYNDDFVSWGIVEGTSIGYIYVWSWYWHLDVSEQFYEAVYNLMNNYETIGLIFDFRLNYGGSMEIAHDGYSLLFNETLEKVSFDVRGDPDRHLYMVPSTTHTSDQFVIRGNPATFYDKPIAVLTGPNAMSNGDWESLRMQFHPMVRSFGKSTNGAFTISDNPNLGNSDFYFNRAIGTGYLIEGHEYMAHRSANIDEEIWLTQGDVANGDDTVVERAMEWITNNTSVKNDAENYLSEFYLSNNYPNPFNPSTKITYSIPYRSFVTIKVFDALGNEIAALVKEEMFAGIYEIDFDAGGLTNGVYFYQLATNNYVKTKKMILIK